MSDPQECKAVLKNILHRTDWQSVSLGDLFLDEAVARFIPYSGFRYSAPIVSGAAAVLGGLVGAVSNRLLDGTLSDAVPRAKKARVLEWAMEPAKRADRHAGTIKLEKAAVKRLETAGGITFETVAGTEIFGYAFDEDAATYSDVLKQWYSGSLVSNPSVAQYGIGIGHPAPLDFIESTLAAGHLEPHSTEAAAELSKDTDYLKRLAEVFGTYDKRRREQLLRAWRAMPGAFKSHLAAFMATKSEGSEQLPILSMLFVLLGITGIGYAVHGFIWISSHEGELEEGSFAASGLMEIGIGLVSVLTVIIAVIAVAEWLGKRGYRKMLVAFAGHHTVPPVAGTGAGDAKPSELEDGSSTEPSNKRIVAG